MLVKKNLGQKKNSKEFLVQKTFKSNENYRSNKFWVQTNSGSKKILCQKIWIQKHFGSKQILGPKI